MIIIRRSKFNQKIWLCLSENITSTPKETTAFTYSNSGWKDQLVSVNGVELTYDENCNVLTYGDKEYSWENGRNLAQITDGDNTYIPIYLLEVDILVYFVKQHFQKLDLN